MRVVMMMVAASISLAACSKGDKQADALDQAARQSDPAAAAVLHNQADAIRDAGDSSNAADVNSPAQAALQAAGNAATATPPQPRPEPRKVDPQTGLQH